MIYDQTYQTNKFDKLLAKIASIAHTKIANEARNDYLLVLLAVIELHKINKQGQCSQCLKQHEHGWGKWTYQCPTIQAIEKELI